MARGISMGGTGGKREPMSIVIALSYHRGILRLANVQRNLDLTIGEISGQLPQTKKRVVTIEQSVRLEYIQSQQPCGQR